MLTFKICGASATSVPGPDMAALGAARVLGDAQQGLRGTAAEAYGFFRAWLSDPLRVAAVMPSGRALASVITAEISAATGPVIELGPGTGSFTRALIARGVPQERLALIEFGSEFAVRLQHLFPHAHTLRMDASRLRDVELFGGERAGAVVSGLPLLSMPPRKVMAILGAAFWHMRPDGAFYQFTYGPRCPVPRALLDRLGLKATRIGGALANVPPAAVYRIRRRGPRSLAYGRRPEEGNVVDAVARPALIGSGDRP